jgi:hypothetical protein
MTNNKKKVLIISILIASLLCFFVPTIVNATSYSEQVPTSYEEWVDSYGGASGLKGNLEAVCVIIDGYIDQNLDFTVKFKNVLDTIYYYAVKSQIDEDTDGDGVNDYNEIHYYGTDPSEYNTDGDGVNDYNEIHYYGTDSSEYDNDRDGVNDYDEIHDYSTDPSEYDNDRDGVNDYNEIHDYSTDPSEYDTDGDGVNDYDEIHDYSTDPLEYDTDGDGVNDYNEIHDYSTDPLEYDTDGDGVNDYNEIHDYCTDPLEYDTDGDGLNDYDEIHDYGTDPSEYDTDGDGLNDYNEIHDYGTDPSEYDTDGDGLNDYNEIHDYSTDPLEYDTDGDGLNDYNEIHDYSTDPLEYDTDGDGLNDYNEIHDYSTDPSEYDTDGDGVNDYDEIHDYGTDPLEYDTDGDGVNDYDEIHDYGTDPLEYDTDGDVLNDYDEIHDYGTDPSEYDTDPRPIPKSFEKWVNSYGGPSGLEGNSNAFNEIENGFLHQNLDFTVTFDNYLKSIDYYFGLPTSETTEMSTGLCGYGQGGGIWYGAYKYLTFTESDEGNIMQVDVQSNGHELRIELWEGSIEQNDHYWWDTHSQEAVSIGTGSSPQIELNPQLCWTIKPGDYTLFFADCNHDGEIIPYTIDYKIEYLTYDVVITDVIYDPPGPEPDDELIKLCNQGSSAVDIGGWRLTDGEGTYTIPSGTTLTAGSSWSVFGSTYNPTRYTQGLYLANSHDKVILFNKDGIKIDEYHW